MVKNCWALGPSGPPLDLGLERGLCHHDARCAPSPRARMKVGWARGLSQPQRPTHLAKTRTPKAQKSEGRCGEGWDLGGRAKDCSSPAARAAIATREPTCDTRHAQRSKDLKRVRYRCMGLWRCRGCDKLGPYEPQPNTNAHTQLRAEAQMIMVICVSR